jgi:hypothetical protein
MSDGIVETTLGMNLCVVMQLLDLLVVVKWIPEPSNTQFLDVCDC